MALQPDGAILTGSTSGDNFVVPRFEADVRLDTSFGQNRIARVHGGAGVQLRGLQVQPNGRIILAAKVGISWNLVGLR